MRAPAARQPRHGAAHDRTWAADELLNKAGKVRMAASLRLCPARGAAPAPKRAAVRRRCGTAQTQECRAVPVLQRITPLRFVLRCARDTARVIGSAVLLLAGGAAMAQPYPSRPVTMIVPFAPGGPADFLGRLIGQKLGDELGQQIVVDNRAGANTIIGAQAVAKAKPDGYTILMAIDGTLVMNPFLYSKLAYDPFKDFEPVSLIAMVPSG